MTNASLLIETLLTNTLQRKSFDSMAAWFEAFNAQTRRFESSIDRAILGGRLSLNVGFAFTSGYQSAIESLFLGDSLKDGELALSSLCVSEVKGNHPRAIETRLYQDGGRLFIDGNKQFVSGACDAQMIYVACRDETMGTGFDDEGRPKLKVVAIPTQSHGVVIQAMPALGFMPEISHGKVRLAEVEIFGHQILDGDGYLAYVKAFRTYEDVHVLAAIVGYTNAGKTTLFNALTDNSQYAADKPFATLDSVTRKNAIPELGPILFSDTVGFISDLPTQLIESFKATLDELRAADLLVHVVDIADENFHFKVDQVIKLLAELNLSHIPILRVNNKSDKAGIIDYRSLSMPDKGDVWVSAENKEGLEELIDSINIFLRGGLFKGWVILKASLGDLRSKLYSSGSVIEETSNEAGLLQLRIEIGNDELLELESIEGFEVLDKEQINIKEAV